MKKFGVALLLFVLVFSVGVVGADVNECPADNEIIMRLSSFTNAHGAFWNDSHGYDWEICTPNREIINARDTGFEFFLSDTFNAHVSDKKIVGSYSESVGFGLWSDDGYCSIVNGACGVGFKCVVTLSNLDGNAHLAACGDGGYVNKVCCVAVSGVWADMNGVTITGADLGDTVQMISSDGDEDDVFEIYENDNLFTNLFDPFNDKIRVEVDNISGVDVGGNLIGVWTITVDDLIAANGDYEGFFFEVDEKTSGPLSVSPDRDDDRMNVTVVSPECGIHFNEWKKEGDELVDIEVFASDDDDEIIGTLTIGGVEVGTFGNGGVVRNGDGDVVDSYKFSSAGNVQIVADAVNSRGMRSRSVSSVMVLDFPYINGKQYVAACISEPEDYQSFEGSVVEFNASTSRAIEIDSSFEANEFSDSDLIIPGGNLGETLGWYWTFYPEGITKNHPAGAIGTADALTDYSFIADFPIAGDNFATLRLELL